MTRSTLLSAVTLAALATGAVALAPLGSGDFDLSWRTMDGGGGSSIGGAFALAGTVGQPDAGPPSSMTGGDFALTGGFWSRRPCPEDLSGNGVVDFEDILEVLPHWGEDGSMGGDINGDGIVNFEDILAVLTAWGPCP